MPTEALGGFGHGRGSSFIGFEITDEAMPPHARFGRDISHEICPVDEQDVPALGGGP